MKKTPTVRMLSRSSLLLVAWAALGSSGCEREEPPGASPSRVASVAVQSGRPELPRELSPSPSASSATPAPAPTPTAVSAPPAFPEGYQGSWFAVTSQSAGVYLEPRFEATKYGYIRNGGRVPVEGEPVSRKNCTRGWYKLLSGGFVCGNLGTTDLSHPEVKFATNAPNLGEVLPYAYARNAKNGTPLYRSVPSREQMERYEPYLVAKPKEEPAATKPASDAVSGASRTAPGPSPSPSPSPSPPPGTAPAPPPPVASPAAGAALADGGLVTAAATQDPVPEKPWWQREDVKGSPARGEARAARGRRGRRAGQAHGDGLLRGRRSPFSWNGRSWYKTTKGLVAPSDRFWQTGGLQVQRRRAGRRDLQAADGLGLRRAEERRHLRASTRRPTSSRTPSPSSVSSRLLSRVRASSFGKTAYRSLRTVAGSSKPTCASPSLARCRRISSPASAGST